MSKTGIGNIGNSPKMFIILTQTDFSSKPFSVLKCAKRSVYHDRHSAKLFL